MKMTQWCNVISKRDVQKGCTKRVFHPSVHSHRFSNIYNQNGSPKSFNNFRDQLLIMTWGWWIRPGNRTFPDIRMGDQFFLQLCNLCRGNRKNWCILAFNFLTAQIVINEHSIRSQLLRYCEDMLCQSSQVILVSLSKWTVIHLLDYQKTVDILLQTLCNENWLISWNVTGGKRNINVILKLNSDSNLEMTLTHGLWSCTWEKSFTSSLEIQLQNQPSFMLMFVPLIKDRFVFRSSCGVFHGSSSWFQNEPSPSQQHVVQIFICFL